MSKFSEVQKLTSLVGGLCHKLDRPVCSRDIKLFLKEHPDQIPFLHQRLGQLLIKAAIKRNTAYDRLVPVGIIGNQTYYCIGSQKGCLESFRRHSRLIRMQQVASWRLPDYAMAALSTAYADAARNAMAGFIQEWEGVSHECEHLDRQVQEARSMASDPFKLHIPQELISRNEAQKLLIRRIKHYGGALRAKHFNPNRPLAFLGWPQSQLFPTHQALQYHPGQIAAYVAWKSGVESNDRLFLSFYDPKILEGTNIP